MEGEVQRGAFWEGPVSRTHSSVQVGDLSNHLCLSPNPQYFISRVCHPAKRRQQKRRGTDACRTASHPLSAFSTLPCRLSVGGSIDSDSGGSAPQSSWELASFFCHYISKMTLFSNPAKADKYHQPVTSYISNSNIAASKSFYISISFAGSGR